MWFGLKFKKLVSLQSLAVVLILWLADTFKLFPLFFSTFDTAEDVETTISLQAASWDFDTSQRHMPEHKMRPLRDRKKVSYFSGLHSSNIVIAIITKILIRDMFKKYLLTILDKYLVLVSQPPKCIRKPEIDF